MRILLAILLCLALCACDGAGTAPLDADAVRALLTDELAIIAEGINREDPVLASQPVGDLFVMGNNIAVRYVDTGWGGQGIGAFRAFFAASLNVYDNILQKLELTDLEVTGDVAVATVQEDFSAVRIDRAPPENVTASSVEYFIFEREDGAWLLIRWDEIPPPPAEEGGGGA